MLGGLGVIYLVVQVALSALAVAPRLHPKISPDLRGGRK